MTLRRTQLSLCDCGSCFRCFRMSGIWKLMKIRSGRLRRVPVLRILVLVLFLSLVCVKLYYLFLRYYVFEAKLNVVYLDNKNDLVQENKLGYVSADFSDDWEYFVNFHESKLFIQKPGARKEDPEINKGYWIYQQNGRGGPSIELTNFQSNVPKNMTMGIRFHIEGKATIFTTFIASPAEEETLAIDYNDKDHSFCTKILQPSSNEFFHKVLVQVSTFTPSSFIAIDRLVLTVGSQSLQMMYTLMPDQWCAS